MAVGTAPLVSVRNASFGYNGVGVLSDVNFTVSSGEVVVVTGHNGSGKSTMTKGMLGLCEVLSGDVEMFGTPHAEFTQRSRVGYVPQRHTVGGPLPATVREVVASGRLGRLPWYKWLSTVDHGIVDKAIETVALISQRDVPVDNLSGGQQRRVLIARAIAAEPELMLMDEPTAGVDVANQQLLVQSLVKLVNQGMALVIVSHELEPLLPIATRRVTVEHGHLVSDENLSTSVTHDSTPQLRIPEQAATPPELTETVESAARQTVSTATQHQIRPQLADRRTAARPGRVIASSRPSRLRPLKPAVIQPTHQYLWR